MVAHDPRIVAQEVLAFRAQFAAHIRGQRALATRDGSLIEANVTLATDQCKLHRVQNRGLAHTVDADEIRRAVARDGRVFKGAS